MVEPLAVWCVFDCVDFGPAVTAAAATGWDGAVFDMALSNLNLLGIHIDRLEAIRRRPSHLTARGFSAAHVVSLTRTLLRTDRLMRAQNSRQEFAGNVETGFRPDGDGERVHGV